MEDLGKKYHSIMRRIFSDCIQICTLQSKLSKNPPIALHISQANIFKVI